MFDRGLIPSRATVTRELILSQPFFRVNIRQGRRGCPAIVTAMVNPMRSWTWTVQRKYRVHSKTLSRLRYWTKDSIVLAPLIFSQRKVLRALAHLLSWKCPREILILTYITLKAIPHYCIAHPVLCIKTRNQANKRAHSENTVLFFNQWSR